MEGQIGGKAANKELGKSFLFFLVVMVVVRTTYTYYIKKIIGGKLKNFFFSFSA